MNRFLLVVMLFSLGTISVVAGETEFNSPPVAVRFWGQGMISIETWWNLTVVIDPYDERIGYDRLGYEEIDYQGPKLTADLVLITKEQSDYNKPNAVKGKPVIVQGLDPQGRVQMTWGALDRPANAKSPTWQQGTSDEPRPKNLSPHAVVVETLAAKRYKSTGDAGEAVAIFVVEVGGVRIAHLGEFWPARLTDIQLKSLGSIDVLCVPQGEGSTVDAEHAWTMVEQIRPRFLVSLDYKRDWQAKAGAVGTAILEKYPGAMIRDGNTLAVSAAEAVEDQDPLHVILMFKPWQPDGELEALMKKMDESCHAAQEVFAPLSANQMNWKPPNGTHTPRWNTEHMMGRQLGFFSQIFAAANHQLFSEIDPKWSMMSPIDLNPKQMPADYQPAHPDWNGAEEARQMQRANSYVRRFAYLLDDVELDEQAPGSRWTLRGLLKQMDRHFTEHTANVQKKFELEGWPEK